jgi:hypothetical protein
VRDYTFQVFEDILICHPDYSNALMFFQPACPFVVLRNLIRMHISIYFNCQFCFHAIEVEHEPPDGSLPSEMDSERVSSQARPQQLFRGRLRLAKMPGELSCEPSRFPAWFSTLGHNLPLSCSPPPFSSPDKKNA